MSFTIISEIAVAILDDDTLLELASRQLFESDGYRGDLDRSFKLLPIPDTQNVPDPWEPSEGYYKVPEGRVIARATFVETMTKSEYPTATRPEIYWLPKGAPKDTVARVTAAVEGEYKVRRVAR